MLKIKDGIDLKELEKFGFEPRYNEDGDIIKYAIIRESSGYTSCKIPIVSFDVETYELDCYNAIFFETAEILFDLIQAGLVEKVSDE